MHRPLTVLAGLTLLFAPPVSGQDDPGFAHIYEAYYQISYDDLEEWNRQYHEYSVPVLTALQEEGVIQGWNQWQHQTGSEYNVRFAARVPDWASISTFWSEYLSRLEEATPADVWEAGGHMILAHTDQIWDAGEVHVPEDLDIAYMYASTYRYNFGDEDEWNRLWSDVVGPILQEAMDEGLLGGWVKLNHNTGGPHNSKVLYMFEDWDDIDDLFEKLSGRLAEEHPEDLSLANQLNLAHDDVIWAPTPGPGM